MSDLIKAVERARALLLPATWAEYLDDHIDHENRDNPFTFRDLATILAALDRPAGEGCKLVPVEPTEAMLDAATMARGGRQTVLEASRATWQEMIAATPSPSKDYVVPYRSECDCPCHKPGIVMMHIRPCCRPD